MLDILIPISVELERLKAGQVREVRSRIVDLGRDIVGIIVRNEQGLTGPFSSPSRRAAILGKAGASIASTFNSIRRGWPRSLADISRWYVQRTANDINQAAGVPLYRRLTDKQIQRIAEEVLIQGAPSADWWKKQNANLRDKFIRQMNEGVAQNETIAELIRRVRGTKAAGYSDGIMEASQRDAEALVRTSIQAAANGARLRQYEASEAIKALQHLSTLDSRTTLICMARDNLMWDKETKRPLGGHNKRFLNPPLHFKCRSTIIGLVHSLAELERLGFRIPDSTRASMDGADANNVQRVSSAVNYEEWLRTKPEEFQLKQLGRARYDLWKSGQLPFTMLIDQSNRPLLVSELT